MDQHKLTCYRSRSTKAFTLIELLVVAAIMSLLLGLAVTGTSGGLESLKMKQAIQSTRYTMERARQLAMTQNKKIAVRIYETPDDSGVLAWRSLEYGILDAVTDPSAPKYTDPTAAGFSPPFKSLGSAERLPEGLVFHPSTTFTTLIGNDAQLKRGTEDAPGGGTRKFVSFVVLPDGSCDLSSTNPWTLTIVKESTLSSGEDDLPANFVTIQINPRTGRTSLYRPDIF